MLLQTAERLLGNKVTVTVQRNRSSLEAADTNDAKFDRVCVHQPGNGCLFRYRQCMGQQGDTSMAVGALLQQLQCPGYAGCRVAAGLWHQRGMQCLQHVVGHGRIGRQWQQGMGRTGVHHDCGLPRQLCLQQAHGFVAHQVQAAGRQVAGQHVRGQLQHYHQRLGNGHQAAAATCQTGRRQGQPGQQRGQGKQQQRGVVVRWAPLLQQPGLKRGWRLSLPVTAMLPEPVEQP